jgi:hypothetical protein
VAATKFGQASVTTATSLSTILGITALTAAERRCKAVTISMDPASTNIVYVGPSTVTSVPANAGNVVTQFQAKVISGYQDNSVFLDEIYVAATVGATNVFVTAVF